MTQLKFIIEQHSDGFVAYPLGLQGAVVGEGDAYEEAFADVKSAARFHIQTFGDEAFPSERSEGPRFQPRRGGGV